MGILPYFQKLMHILWFRSNFSSAAWEGECALPQRVLAETTGMGTILVPRAGSSRSLVSPGRMTLSWLLDASLWLPQGRPLHPSPVLQTDQWDPGHHQLLSTCFVSCSFALTPRNRCPPVFLTSCQADDLCFLPLFWITAWVPACKPSPAQVAYNSWLLPVVWCPSSGSLIPNL